MAPMETRLVGVRPGGVGLLRSVIGCFERGERHVAAALGEPHRGEHEPIAGVASDLGQYLDRGGVSSVMSWE
jgi:hypothetical protein